MDRKRENNIYFEIASWEIKKKKKESGIFDTHIRYLIVP